MFKYLLAETKDFKYQVTLKLLFSKCKGNTEREFAFTCFNSSTKIVIDFENSLSKQPILSRGF